MFSIWVSVIWRQKAIDIMKPKVEFEFKGTFRFALVEKNFDGSFNVTDILKVVTGRYQQLFVLLQTFSLVPCGLGSLFYSEVS